MTAPQTLPAPAATDLPTFTIKVDGEALDPALQVAGLNVARAANKIPYAQIVIVDGEPAAQDFPLSASADFLPGKEVEILAGYHSHEETIFKGIITRHGIRSRKDRISTLVLECRDKAVKMTLGRKSAFYKEKKDSELLEALISGYGLQAEVEATDAVHPGMVKFQAGDWDFLVTRAQANGKWVLVEDGKVSIKLPDDSAEPALELLYGATILEFEADMEARDQVAATKGSAWNPADQAMAEEEGADPGLNAPGNVDGATLAGVASPESEDMVHGAAIPSAEIKAWADARFLGSRLARITGRVRCQGFGAVKPGQVLGLEGLGARFNGNVLVSGVRHQMDARGWETDIQFGMDPEVFCERPGVSRAPAAGLVPSVSGLQVGIVSQLEGDPDGEDRILVKIPAVDPDDDGIWARVATLDAGDNRGSFFRPEVGDEVALGFLDQDPRHPVVLGMLNSSAKPAPLQASDSNPLKGFTTRSGIKWIFDDEKKIVIVETPGGNKFTLDDDAKGILLEDINKNKIEMSADGITLESAKDIILKATGDLKAEGVNVELKASAEWKAEGSAGAELKSSATLKIQGSLVQIN